LKKKILISIARLEHVNRSTSDHSPRAKEPNHKRQKQMINPHHILSLEQQQDCLVLATEQGVIRIQSWSDAIVHVAYFPLGITALPHWGLEARPGSAPAFTLHEDEQGWNASLPGASLNISRDDLRIGFCDGQGHERTALRAIHLTPVCISGEQTFQVDAMFEDAEPQGYYGLGQHQTDWMDHNAKEVQLWHDYKGHGGEIIGIPFLVSASGYGLLWDNPSRSRVTPRNGKVHWWSEVGEVVSFFMISGKAADDLYRGFRLLCGETPLPPLSALGYIQCKQRYQSRDELMQVAKTCREKGYPCDMLIVDWFHWKHLGDMDLDETFWPDARGMNEELAAMGYRVMISCWPRFMKESAHYPELERKGWFMKDAAGETLYGNMEDQRGALIDTTNPETGRWYWETIRDSYGAKGFTSWWQDENEPDICPHGFYLHAGTGARVHNLYPLTHTRAVFEGHRRDDRCLILSRSAYFGAQKNGTTFWSSDIYPTWDVFRRQIPCGLNFCATGFAWWSCDIGGWQASEQASRASQAGGGASAVSGNYQSLLLETQEADRAAPIQDYAELYVRWFQYAAFCPTFRAHGSRPANEIWSFGPEAEAILRKYVELRYRLLPYIYSLAWKTRQTGAPFMRALFMDFGQDPAVRDIKTQYMFGPAFLVAPVCEEGATSREVYLPKGCGWYDYWSNRRYEGGQSVRMSAPLDLLPLYVREGSIVPHGEVIPHTGIAQKKLELWVYEGADAEFELYHDDGISYNYEKGDYHLTTLRWHDARQALSVENDTLQLFQDPDGGYLSVKSRHPNCRS